MDDARIIELYFERNDTAIAETDRKYGRACLALSENITGNRLDAEECVNDTYLGLWNAIPPARPDPFSSFVFRITRNLSIARYHANRAAKRDRQYELSLSELEECIGDGGLCEDDRAITRAVEHFLESESSQNRVIFMRRYWFSDSYTDISTRTGLSEKVISMRLVRMRERLRKALAKEGILI